MMIRSYFIGCFRILCYPIFLMLGVAMIIAASDTRADEHYLRFGFGLDHPDTSFFHDKYCNSDHLLYGCREGRDGIRPIRSLGNFGNVPVVEFGIGYPSGRTRWELSVAYRPSSSFSGNATYRYNIDQIASAKNISSLAGMVAGYIDLNEIELLQGRKAIPFVGAGLGIARHRMNEFQIRFPNTTTIIPGAEKTNLAWMITAGLGFQLDENQTLDLSWRYTDLGSLQTGVNGWVINNSTGVRTNLTHIPTVAELKGHGIRLSLRIKL